jgi:hypothetical protein
MSASLPVMTVDLARQITGGLSKTSKMDHGVYSFGLPTHACQTGSRLAQVKGSTCRICYAKRGRYPTAGVQRALERRLARLDHPRWVEAMTFQVRAFSPEWMRWFDSGDIRDMAMLERIIEVCRRTPQTKHWLPTQERHLIMQYMRAGGEIPDNLCVRISAPMIGGVVPTYRQLPMVTASIVVRSPRSDVFMCPARQQNNRCGACRSCWSRDVRVVAYQAH